MIKNKYLKEILQTMCSFVGADYDKIDFTKEFWFMGYSWEKAKEDTFIFWLTTYLIENKEARKSLMLFPTNNKLEIARWASKFVANYGWSIQIT